MQLSEQGPTKQGKVSAKGLRRSTIAEERKVATQKGCDLAIGADRVEERSKSSDGESAETKQKMKH